MRNQPLACSRGLVARSLDRATALKALSRTPECEWAEGPSISCTPESKIWIGLKALKQRKPRGSLRPCSAELA
eukprot:1899480-Alexandrium_andersonii.AAC.1